MATNSPYQKFVFDFKKRKFLGRFEEMYSREGRGKFDSWHQETLTTLTKQACLMLCERYSFARILDIGCGKGAFTHLLKKQNNEVLGLDLSATAVSAARAKFPEVRFRVGDVRAVARLPGRFDLAVMMEILSYIEDWKGALKTVARKSDRLLASLYIPPNPIGFIPGVEAFVEGVRESHEIENKLVLDDRHVIVMARARRRSSSSKR